MLGDVPMHRAQRRDVHAPAAQHGDECRVAEWDRVDGDGGVCADPLHRGPDPRGHTFDRRAMEQIGVESERARHAAIVFEDGECQIELAIRLIDLDRPQVCGRRACVIHEIGGTPVQEIERDVEER